MNETVKRGKFARVEAAMAERHFFKSLFAKLGQIISNCLSGIRQGLDNGIAVLTRGYISASTKVQNNKVVFMHYGNVYQCNPSYICDEILREKLPWEIVYVSNKKIMNTHPFPFPEGVRVVQRNSLEFFYELASAKVWVDNAMCMTWEYLPKKKEQIYINTWHGSMGLKRIDAEKVVSPKWAKASKKASEITNYMISNSTFETEVYRSTYWKDQSIKVLEYGHPRNDILFSNEKQKREIHKKVCDFFGVSEACKFILYAPTFRDAKNLDCYDIDYNRVIEAAQKRFGGEWKILNRYHYKVASALKKVKELRENPNILSSNAYSDIQELMVASDIGITDYSSWICDFVLTGKPGFIYANDIDKYDDERGFYYPLDSTPFPIAVNNDQLYENILKFDATKYAEEKDDFIQARGCKEDGNASRRVVELIKSVMEECKEGT